MKRRLQFAICALTLVAADATAMAGEVVDRIVVSVNRSAILESEWDEALRYESFLNQHPLQTVTRADKQAVLQRLIDQSLIEQQMRLANFRGAGSDEIARKIQEIREQLLGDRKAEADAESEWHSAMTDYGLTDDQLSDLVARQLSELRFIDQRFRPAVQVDSKRVEHYYNETLLPQLRRSRAMPVPLEKVASQIRELLTQQTVDELLAAWLRSLREQSVIEVR